MNRKSIRFRLLFASGLVAVIAFCMALGFSYLPQYKTEAQTSLPASMSAIQVGNIAVMSGQLGAGTKETPWMDIMSTSIKTSQMKDLMMTASLEVGLYTNTLVNSKNGTSDTSSASAGVEVQVIIDPGPNQRIADPGVVVFGRRTQTLSATLQGLISGCQTVDPTTGAVIINPTCVTPESIQLILDTMNANSFVFALPNLGSGVHTMKMQAKIRLNNTVQTGSVQAMATIGKGTFAVQEVRLVNGADITL